MFHILVVDDDENARILMREILESENYTVSDADNGETALEVLEKEHIDIVILDIMMPKMDGYEFTKMLRESDSELPILMISAKQMSADRKKGYRLGIDDYMSKPVDEEEMLLRVKNLLRRAKIASEKKLVIGDVVLDYDSLTVTRNDEVQKLPQKEFCLLFKLLSEPGRIFTRIQLMDEIWGTESTTDWETITVHIARHRKRFEDYEEFEIQSVRGLGYRAVKKV